MPVFAEFAGWIFKCKLPIVDIAYNHFLGVDFPACANFTVDSSVTMCTEDDMTFMLNWIFIIKKKVFFCSSQHLAAMIRPGWINWAALGSQLKFFGLSSFPQPFLGKNPTGMFGAYPDLPDFAYTRTRGGDHAIAR